MFHQNGNDIEVINGDTSTDNIDRKKKRRISKKDSSSEGTLAAEQKKKNRMESNRLAARESRKRQKEYIAMLEQCRDNLQMELKKVKENLNTSLQECSKLAIENSQLKLHNFQLQDNNRKLLETNTKLNQEKIESFAEDKRQSSSLQEMPLEFTSPMQSPSSSFNDSSWGSWLTDSQEVQSCDSQNPLASLTEASEEESFASSGESSEDSPTPPTDGFDSQSEQAAVSRKHAQQITLGFLQQSAQSKPDPLLTQIAENLNAKFGQRK